MHLPWKKSKSKSKSGRISRFVSDLQQSPKRGGSLVVETGFPTSLIDLFVKNRDRLKKRNNKAPTLTAPTRPRVLSPPLPQKLDPEDLATSTIDESSVDGSGLASDSMHGGDNNIEDGGNGGGRGGGCCVLTVGVVKVFAVAVLALSTRKLAVGITISAFALLFLELAVARVFTQLIGKKKKKKKREEEKVEESSSSSMEERENNKICFEIIESFQDSVDCIQEVQLPPEEREVVLIKEKSRSAKLKSKIANKLRSYKKKKVKQEAEGVEVVEEVESLTEVSSLHSDDTIGSQVSERDATGSNPPLLKEEGEESGSKGDVTKVIFLVVIALAGLLSGKFIAVVLTLSSCLILRFVCCKSQTSL